MAEDKQAAEAFGRALRPYIVWDAVCVLAGIAGMLLTDEVFWIILGAAAGGIPTLLFVLRHTREAEAARKRGSARIVE